MNNLGKISNGVGKMELRKNLNKKIIKQIGEQGELRDTRKPTNIPDRREKCVSLICMQRFIVHIILLYLRFI